MELKFLLYRSIPARRTTAQTVQDILQQSRENNPREGLTGFLHVDGEMYLQYIEGHPGPLGRKVRHIQKDRRHQDFLILAEGDLPVRLFPDWAMGELELADTPKEPLLAARPWRNWPPSLDIKGLLDAFVVQSLGPPGMPPGMQGATAKAL